MQTFFQFLWHVIFSKRNKKAIILGTSPSGKNQKAEWIITVQAIIPQNHTQVLAVRRNDPQFCPEPAGIGIHAFFPALYKRGDKKRCLPLIHSVTNFNMEFICCRIIKQPCQITVLGNRSVTNCKNLHSIPISSRASPRLHLSMGPEVRLPDLQKDMHGILLSGTREACGIHPESAGDSLLPNVTPRSIEPFCPTGDLR